ncbi:2-oxo acid dehydrogenase subunit E2, partial [Rhodoblastus acidophilus]
RLKNSPQFAGVKVSPLLIMAKAIIWAVRRNPMVNSAWTDKEILVRHFVNLGIAAATPRGLIVPNVKEAQSMSLLELAQALEQLTLTARDGKTTPTDMQDGTITITNIGVFGMDTGTPILNPGEVAIVALGTIKQKPWVVDGEVRSRMVTTIG